MFAEAEDAAVRVPELYSPAAADSISYGATVSCTAGLPQRSFASKLVSLKLLSEHLTAPTSRAVSALGALRRRYIHADPSLRPRKPEYEVTGASRQVLPATRLLRSSPSQDKRMTARLGACRPSCDGCTQMRNFRPLLSRPTCQLLAGPTTMRTLCKETTSGCQVRAPAALCGMLLLCNLAQRGSVLAMQTCTGYNRTRCDGSIGAGGNGRLVNELARDVPILYRSEVTHVHHGTAGVTVETHDGRAVTADACLVTVPLGVLKAGRPRFTPALTPEKHRAIERMGYESDAPS